VIQGLQYNSGGRVIKVDLKDRLERLSMPLEERVDSTSAAAKAASDRRLTQALARKNVSPEVLADELIAAMQARRALEVKVEDVDYLQDVATSKDPAEKRLRVLVAYAREIQLLGTVRQLAR
jgi:hypothetical protein